MTHNRKDRDERSSALVQRFLNKEFSEDVLRASLKALGLYADEVRELVYDANYRRIQCLPKKATR